MPLIAKIASTNERVDITKLKNPRAELKAGDLVCQLCGSPMIIKQGMIKKPHFAHKAECTSDYQSHPESPEHLAGKELIAKTLKAELPEYSLAEIEYEFPIPEVRRIADVVAKFPNGWIVAHECQLASITVEELEKRTEDYLYAGVDVIWWLGKAANTKSNLDWSHSKFGFALVLNYEQLSAHAQGSQDSTRMDLL
jgi:competence protein CoiA